MRETIRAWRSIAVRKVPSIIVLLGLVTVATGFGRDMGERTNGLRLNFRGVPLENVLNYLSEAAGFIIVLQARPLANVDVWSDQLLSKDEALSLLNSVLHHQGCAAVLNGRTLSVMTADAARVGKLPVKLGSDPELIPPTDQVVTQVIPLRYIEAAQILKDLQPLVAAQATLIANESANSLVITDVQANIHRLAEIIKAIDLSAEDPMVIRIFHLRNSDPVEMADLLSELFPDPGQSDNNSSSVPFAGGPPGFPGPPPGGGFGGNMGGDQAAGSNNQAQRVKNRGRVVAVADQRTTSVLVTAANSLIDQIERLVTRLDLDPTGKQSVKVYQLRNAHPQQISKVLQEMFQQESTSSSRAGSTQDDPFTSRSSSQSQQNNSASKTSLNSSLGGGSTPSPQ